MKVTPFMIKVLRVLERELEDGITPKFLAWEIWPNSPAWKRVYNTGLNGATSGKGMWLCAGSYLSKLVYAKYAYQEWKGCYFVYKLSSKGHEAIKEWENK